MRRASWAVALFALAAACQRRSTALPLDARPAGPRDGVVTILATSELRGTPEPCGCQSDPLGDVARVAELLAEARRDGGGALLVDAGGLRYAAEPVKPAERAQAELKAEFLEKAMQDLGAEVGLGDEDLAFGVERLPAGRRLAANVSWSAQVESGPKGAGAGGGTRAFVIREVNGLRIGIFGVTRELPGVAGVTRSEPVAAARAAVARLRGEGAHVIVALAHLGRSEARRLAREVPGLAIVVAGDEVGDDGAEPEQVGETILVEPAQQAMKVARVELHVVGGQVSTQLVAGAESRAAGAARLRKKLQAIGVELDRLLADPSADPDFLKTKHAEKTRLAAELAGLVAPPAPPAGAYAVATLVPIKRRIPRDPQVSAAMKALDARAGEANRAAAAPIPVPPAAPGQPHFVGMEECELCHPKALKQWALTVHAKAWVELEKVDKQWSYDCISCHVTGYGLAGGSAMAHVDDLKDVQCEVCHGPGSLHADKPKVFHLENPGESRCKDCHTREHSDTFQYQAYLRDIVGPGHGEKRRAALGPGITGHELRHGAIERARME